MCLIFHHLIQRKGGETEKEVPSVSIRHIQQIICRTEAFHSVNISPVIRVNEVKPENESFDSLQTPPVQVSHHPSGSFSASDLLGAESTNSTRAPRQIFIHNYQQPGGRWVETGL